LSSSFTGYSYITNKIPAVTSDYWKEPVKQLMEEWRYYDEASSELRENLWPECARAYNCRRDLPTAEAMQWLDGSDLGETDIWDGINFLTDSIMNAQMPRDQSYLELLAYDDDDQGNLNDVRDLLMSLFRKADIRGQYGNHVKQTLIYGTSVVKWNWERITANMTFGPAETHRRLLEAGAPPELINPDTFHKDYKKFMFPVPKFNGPIVQTVDMYDFWMDPAATLVTGPSYPIIVRFYMTTQDLKDAEDSQGEKKYSNLDGIEGKTLEEIYGKDPQRLLIVRELGTNPVANSAGSNGVKLVPIYMFHKTVRTFDSDPSNRFTDCFFYVAEGNKNDEYKLIRVEQNPNSNGSRGIFVDTYVDFLSGGYGIGAVEKSLNAWQYKNVIAALGLNAQVASGFPAYSVIAGILPDDQELGLSPGSLTTIKNVAGVGLNYIAPLPVPANVVELGQKNEQWYAQKILGQMQASGAMVAQDPVKSIKTSKTATQINTESTSGSIIRDSYLEKMVIRSLEPLMQDIYDAARENLTDPVLHFDRMESGGARMGQVTQENLDQERKVILTGYHGLVNKAKEIEELREALQVIVTGNLLQIAPQLIPVAQKVAFRLLGRLGIKNLDEFEQDPISMMLQSPGIMQQVMNNPKDMQAVLEMAQQIQQMQMQQQQAQMQQGGPPGPGQPPPHEPQGPYQPNGSMQSPQTNPLIPRPPEDLSGMPGHQ